MVHLLHGCREGLMATSSKRTDKTHCANQVCSSQSPCLCGRPLLTHASAGDTQTFKDRSGSVWGVSGSWCAQSFVWTHQASLAGMGFDSKCYFTPLPSCWGFSFALGCVVSFYTGIQYSSLDGCLAASCNFGALPREDACTPFYLAILIPPQSIPSIRKLSQASCPYPSKGIQNENHSNRKLTKLITWITALFNPWAMNPWANEPMSHAMYG